MKLDAKTDLKHLKVDGGMTNGDFAMKLLADIGGFSVVRPEMREYVGLVLRSTKNLVRFIPDPLLWALQFSLDLLSAFSDGISPNLRRLVQSIHMVVASSSQACLKLRGRKSGRDGSVQSKDLKAGRLAQMNN